MIATLTQTKKRMRNLFFKAAGMALLLGAAALAGAQEYRQLKAEDAYRYAAADTGSTIEIDWFVEPGYYMYRGKMSYESGSDAIVLGEYALPGGEPQHSVAEEQSVTVETDGPYRVVGVPLAAPRLAEGASAHKYVLCRCGASKNKPYCDGSHYDIGWKAAAS